LHYKDKTPKKWAFCLYSKKSKLLFPINCDHFTTEQRGALTGIRIPV
jgi:hypothetical protein